MDLENKVGKYLDSGIKGWSYEDWQDACNSKSFGLDDLLDDMLKEFSSEDQDYLLDIYNKWKDAINELSEEEFTNLFNESLKEAVEIHDQLNPKIWTEDKELRPEVRAKVLQIVDKFKTQLLVDKVELKVEDIYILGSNANYNYTEESDLDVHIIADESFDCSAEHLPLLYNCYKALFNSKYDIRIRGINVELYVENKDALSNVSAGIYSLKDGWIRNPSEYEIPEFDQVAVDKEVQKWEDKYYELTENPTVKKIDEYIDGLYDLRKDSIKNGEFAEGNLVFKEIRRRGYLDDLKELKIELTSQELSLESLDEAKTKLTYHYRGPVYHFNFCIAEDWEDYTEAVSDTQALNNLTVKAKKYFGYILQTKISLNPDYLELVTGEDDIPDENFKPIPKCEKCGHELNDAGECPVCDLGDHTALEEDIKSSCYDAYVDWAKKFEDEEDKQAYIDDVKNNKVLSEKEREELLKLTESVELKEDLIVIEPNEGKEKLSNLKDLIERTTDPQTKDALLTLMDIYLFQTYKPSDREDSSLTDEEWQEIADWLKKQKESELNESLRTDPEAFEDITLECKVRDWYAGNNPFEFQLKDISADLTWQDVIDALKSNDREAFDKLLPLDTEPRENIWKKACQLYYAKTGKMFDGADEQRYIKELLKDEETYDDVVDDDYLTQKAESLSEEQKKHLKELLETLE